LFLDWCSIGGLSTNAFIIRDSAFCLPGNNASRRLLSAKSRSMLAKRQLQGAPQNAPNVK
jgi:hypothetical protein